MFLQNLRAKIGARLNGEGESGFTLIELLVVMLILGILAAIALPAFFNQKEKAGDAKAKEIAHTAQVAVETCATDHGGVYNNAACDTPGELDDIEPTLNGAAFGVSELETNKYKITVTAPSTHTFSITNAAGVMTYTCAPNTGAGGCPAGGDWSK